MAKFRCAMAARSSKRSVRMEYGCLRRFRRRRLLAFLQHSNLPATFDALKRETRVFLDVRFLQRLVVNGRWKEARGYLNSFLPHQDDDDGQILSEEADTVLEFITRFDIFEDLAQGKLGGVDAADDLERQIEAIPSAMADDARYTEGVRTVHNLSEHPAYWGPVDWRQIRLKAVKVVKELVAQIPEFKYLLLFPRCSINPCYTIPFGFGGHRRHLRKNIGRMTASLVALCFLPKVRRQPSPAQGSMSEPTDLCDLIEETIQAGKLKVREHSDSFTEGTPGAPVGLFIVTGEEGCHAESVSSAKLSRIAGEFRPDVVVAPSGGMDPMHVSKKITALADISNDIISLLIDTHAYGPAHSMFVDKLLEQEKLLHELRVDCIKAKVYGRCTGSICTR